MARELTPLTLDRFLALQTVGATVLDRERPIIIVADPGREHERGRIRFARLARLARGITRW